VTSKAFRDRLARGALRAQVTLPVEAIEPLEAYVRLLARWNEKVNLTALPLADPTDASIDRLLIEPLAAARWIPDDWSPWVDVGSGGGSPAIPLKILKPTLRLTMVESKGRKSAFLREAIRELQLRDASVEAVRFEDFASFVQNRAAAGVVTLRAVRLEARLVQAASTVLRQNGHLLVFSASSDSETVAGLALAHAQQLVASSLGCTWLLDYTRTA